MTGTNIARFPCAAMINMLLGNQTQKPVGFNHTKTVLPWGFPMECLKATNAFNTGEGNGDLWQKECGQEHRSIGLTKPISGISRR